MTLHRLPSGAAIETDAISFVSGIDPDGGTGETRVYLRGDTDPIAITDVDEGPIRAFIASLPPLTPESKPSRFDHADWFDSLQAGSRLEWKTAYEGWLPGVLFTDECGRLKFRYDDTDTIRDVSFFWKDSNSNWCRPIEATSELATLRAENDWLRKDLASTRRETGEWSTRVSQIAKSLGLGDAPRCGESYAEFAGRCEAAINALKKREVVAVLVTWPLVDEWKTDGGMIGAWARALLKAREAGAIR